MDRESFPYPGAPVAWRQRDGAPLACVEKIRILNENLEEIRAVCQDALEDAVLMGCDDAQIREAFTAVIAALVNPYTTTDPAAADDGTAGAGPAAVTETGRSGD